MGLPIHGNKPSASPSEEALHRTKKESTSGKHAGRNVSMSEAAWNIARSGRDFVKAAAGSGKKVVTSGFSGGKQALFNAAQAAWARPVQTGIVAVAAFKTGIITAAVTGVPGPTTLAATVYCVATGWPGSDDSEKMETESEGGEVGSGAGGLEAEFPGLTAEELEVVSTLAEDIQESLKRLPLEIQKESLAEEVATQKLVRELAEAEKSNPSATPNHTPGATPNHTPGATPFDAAAAKARHQTNFATLVSQTKEKSSVAKHTMQFLITDVAETIKKRDQTDTVTLASVQEYFGELAQTHGRIRKKDKATMMKTIDEYFTNPPISTRGKNVKPAPPAREFLSRAAKGQKA